jgi:hypothetical protein
LRLNGSSDGRAWESVIEPEPTVWRERRRTPAHHAAVPDLRLIDRRQGVVCRRKDARVGGRRRTDVGAFLATGSSPGL